jgi:hypothetical protein
MAPRTLKALTLIAYHQPMLQSFLARMFGETTYEEVGKLRGLGLIHAEPKGSTLELRTTRAFAEYFGITSTKPEDIRAYLERRLGASSLSIPMEEPTPPGPPPDGASHPEALPSPALAPTPTPSDAVPEP